MAYCPECGSEVSDSAAFCPDCGENLNEDDSESESVDKSETGEAGGEGRDTAHLVSSGAMGVIVGLVVAFAFTNFGGSGPLFLVTVLGVGYYLYTRKSSAREAIGNGLYITAVWILMSPILFYMPVIGTANSETARGTGTVLGGLLGMVIYGFIGLIIAIVVVAAGYFVNRGAD